MHDSSIQFKIAMGLLRYLGFLIAITMYQAGVAIMAQKRGDQSYLTKERATLNPYAHIDILGTILFPIITIMSNFPIVFGWPKYHIVETRYFKNPRRDINIVYLFGVGINFFIALICMITLRFIGGGFFIFDASIDYANSNILIRTMIGIIGLTNITIGSLFLLPFPGTAGWNLLLNNVSYTTSTKLQEKSMIISLVVLGLLMLGVLNPFFNFFISLFLFGAQSSM